MKTIRIGYKSTADYPSCEWCGYPFDRGDKAFDVSGEGFPIVCSNRCGENIAESDGYSKNEWFPPPNV